MMTKTRMVELVRDVYVNEHGDHVYDPDNIGEPFTKVDWNGILSGLEATENLLQEDLDFLKKFQ